MSGDHAFDQYQQACEQLEFAKLNARTKGQLISSVGMALTYASPTIVIEGLNEEPGGEFRSSSPHVSERNWIEFDELRSTVAAWEEALAREEEAWNALADTQRTRIKRCK